MWAQVPRLLHGCLDQDEEEHLPPVCGQALRVRNLVVLKATLVLDTLGMISEVGWDRYVQAWRTCKLQLALCLGHHVDTGVRCSNSCWLCWW